MKKYEIKTKGRLIDPDGTIRDAEGAVIELRPQSRQVLELMVRSADQVVTKDNFAEAVWDGRSVSEDSLVQCIAEIRAALDDGDRSLIQTVPRKGYRFVPPRDASVLASRKSWRLAVLAGLAVLAVIVLGLV